MGWNKEQCNEGEIISSPIINVSKDQNIKCWLSDDEGLNNYKEYGIQCTPISTFHTGAPQAQ